MKQLFSILILMISLFGGSLVHAIPLDELINPYRTVEKYPERYSGRAVGSQKDVPWLVSVQSSYLDEKSKQSIVVEGMGVLIRYQGRVLVLTASHVSQGKNLRVSSSQWGLLQTAGRLASAGDDLEIIEIADTRIQKIDEIFEYKENPQDEGHIDMKALGFEMVPENGAKAAKPIESAKGFFYIANSKYYSGKLKTDAMHIWLGRNWLTPVSPKTQPNTVGWIPVDPRSVVITRKQNLNSLYGSVLTTPEETIAYVKLAEGLSGGPLLGFNEHDGETAIFLDGINKSYHHYLKESYFAGVRQIDILVRNYFDRNLRGLLGEVSWYFNSGLKRQFGPKIKEADSLTQPVGSLRGPIGNAVSVDGKMGPDSKPGLYYKGEHFIGFRNGKDDTFRSADIESLIESAKSANQRNGNFEALTTEKANFSAFVAKKLENKKSNGDCDIKFSPDGRMQIEVSYLGAGVREIKLNLSKNGALPGKEFSPVVKIRDNKGSEVVVNLEKILFGKDAEIQVQYPDTGLGTVTSCGVSS